MPDEAHPLTARGGNDTSAPASAPSGAPAHGNGPRPSAEAASARSERPAAGLTPARSSGSSSRVRARLARLGVQRSTPYNPVLEPLLRIVRGNDPKIDSSGLRQIERAYQVAERWHRGQKRKSGDPYITHPLAVTTILAELGMDPATLMAGLLHDTVEDTEYGLDTLRRDFGDQVA
ncbi:MAG: bifunctional (p)ppGpp synthetase/guanosine-3',5'-bis(diphosphate) 3'-pyrophosphohydrolase, partial [Streptomycetaceae bacterium]|nr:bifunctional (p)ppGpp synthetase/guanosine-3',5'-bis(diphosphate) 3'-pyrophosphohydrolase [Streptomycetaceae bacterium]